MRAACSESPIRIEAEALRHAPLTAATALPAPDTEQSRVDQGRGAPAREHMHEPAERRKKQMQHSFSRAG